MCPFGTTEYDESAYAPTLATLSTGTVYREMDKTKYQLSSQQNYHVMTLADNNVATTEETDLSVATNNDLIDKLGIGRDQSSALIIKASGLTTITLDNPIHSYYDFYKSESQYSKVKYADFDFDGLYDYEEINFSSRFVKEHDNKLLLPTIYECMIDSDKPYVREGFDVFESYYKDKPKAYGRMLNDIRILPIKSDPTSADSDEDGIADGAKPLSKTDDNYLGDNYIEDSHPLQFSYLYYNDRLMELKEIYPNAKFLFEEYNVSLTDFVEFQYESAWKLTDETVYKAPEPEQTRLYYKHKIHYEDMALPNREGLRFYCDINNYLLEDDFVSVFAFYDVSRSNSPTIEEAQYALKGTVFYDYAQDFVDASIQNNLDLTYIISKCIHECGNNGSVLSNGNTATSGLSKDQTVYNVYAVGATDKEGFTPTELGIERASNEGWTTMRLAIIGGAEYIAETYMTAGQYTNYTQNYCLPVYAETGNMGYQYATDMSYAYDEASSVKNKIFNLKGKEELKFLIPYFLEK
jgi:beta-N-acetylglucosaminidase